MRRRGSALIFVLIMLIAMATAVLGIIAFTTHISGAEVRAEHRAAAQLALDGAVADVRSELALGTITGPVTKTVAVGSYNVSITVSDNSGTLANTYKVDGTVTIAGQTYSRSFVVGWDSGQGLAGYYYSSSSATFGTLLTKRTDKTVDFSWGTTAPDPLVPSDTYSVRWVGTVTPTVTGTYTFSTTSDEGVRFYIEGYLVINNWTSHTVATNTSTSMTLTAGQSYAIRLDYYEGTGSSIIQLKWTPPSSSLQVIPASRLKPNYSPLVGYEECDLTSQYARDVISYSGVVDGSFGSTNRTLAAELLPRHIRNDTVRYWLGPPTNGAYNAIPCDGRTVNVVNGNFSQVRLLMVSTASSHSDSFKFNYTSGSGTDSATIYDWRAWPTTYENVAATFGFSYLSGSPDYTNCHIQEVQLSPTSWKTLTSIDLPFNSSDYVLAITCVY